jgi:two-component system sensor histidine kinase TctE
MLALAKVEQLRHQGDAPLSDWAPIARAVALDLGALIAQGGFDFEIETSAAPVRSHEWALRELTRNLLHNAIRHGPPGSRLALRLQAVAGAAVLTIADDGPGLNPDQQARLFQPFAAGPLGGTGLGLAICQEIVRTLGGTIALTNRDGGGLDATVRLPLAENPTR